jgi:hypothetical protein
MVRQPVDDDTRGDRRPRPRNRRPSDKRDTRQYFDRHAVNADAVCPQITELGCPLFSDLAV